MHFNPLILTWWFTDELNDISHMLINLFVNAQSCVVMMSTRSEAGKWNDQYCGRKLPYFCQKPIGKFSRPCIFARGNFQFHIIILTILRADPGFFFFFGGGGGSNAAIPSSKLESGCEITWCLASPERTGKARAAEPGGGGGTCPPPIFFFQHPKSALFAKWKVPFFAN